MNASASALTREGEVQSKIGKVRVFSRFARVVCAALFGFALVGCVGTLIFGVMSQFAGPGLHTPYYLSTPQLSVWAFLSMGLVAGTMLTYVYQLYRLFGNLAVGTIYTPENVRRVRNAGLLWVLLAVLSVLIPIVTGSLVASGYFGASVPTTQELPNASELLANFFSAGVILLASWIMDIGLYEKDHAEALQRDADLVI